jgi:hypothetical protein
MTKVAHELARTVSGLRIPGEGCAAGKYEDRDRHVSVSIGVLDSAVAPFLGVARLAYRLERGCVTAAAANGAAAAGVLNLRCRTAVLGGGRRG